MSQPTAINWNKAPDSTSGAIEAPVVDADINEATVAAALAGATVEVKTKSFAETVEEEARNQIATIKMATDRTRMNDAVAVRVAELVEELGLPPPKTDDDIIAELGKSKLDQYELYRFDSKATEKARDVFFDR